MACCHHLNQWWLTISEVLWHSPQGDFTRNLRCNDTLPMIQYVSRYGHRDMICISIHISYAISVNFVTYHEMSKYDIVYHIVTIHILIHFFCVTTCTAVSWYSDMWCIIAPPLEMLKDIYPWYENYHRTTSNINHTLVCNKTVDHSDVVGASTDGAAPTTSSYLI